MCSKWLIKVTATEKLFYILNYKMWCAGDINKTVQKDSIFYLLNFVNRAAKVQCCTLKINNKDNDADNANNSQFMIA